MTSRRTTPHLLALVLLVVLAACGGGADATAPDAAPAPREGAGASDDDHTSIGPPITGEVVVQAAASLTDAFTEIGELFGVRHPDASVTLNLGGSQTLAAQILQGAPADVFASANATQMAVVADEGLIAGVPLPFASNELAIAVEAGNPLGIDALDDLDDPDLVLVLAAPDVPAGVFAAQALEQAAVTVAPASLEVDVRAVLAKVALGEADAGIVYASDLATADDTVQGITIPPAQNVVATYPIAVLADAPNAAGAQAFIDLVLSPEGRAVLAAAGFGPP